MVLLFAFKISKKKERKKNLRYDRYRNTVLLLGALAVTEIFPDSQRTVSPNRNFNFTTTHCIVNEDLPPVEI